MPSWLGSLVGWSTVEATKPADWMSLVAVLSSSPMTLGTGWAAGCGDAGWLCFTFGVAFTGPSETFSSTWAPFEAVLPPAGDCETTVSFGSLLGTCWLEGARPAAVIAASAEETDRPTTLGTVTFTGVG